MIELRPYQIRAIDELRTRANQRPVLVLPVGAGKTTVASEIIRRVTTFKQRTLFIAHREELIDQAHARLAKFGIHAGIIMGGRPATPSLVQVGSIQTLAKRPFVPADLVIVDEAHHSTAKSYATVLARYPHARLIGLTATPFRTDGRGLGFIFGAIVAPVTVRELIDRGVILEPRVFGPDLTAELKGLRTTAGDYNQKDLGERMNQRRLVGDIVEHWREAAAGKRTIVFAVDVAHSKAIVEQFVAAGVPAEHVDGTTPNRAAIFARLARCETQVVSNCGITTEGWDLPSLEVVVLARPTQSRGLHIQMVGRGMRAAPDNPGKIALVLDHAGNHHKHGMVTDEIEYTLDDRKKMGGAAPVRQCRECFAIFSGGGPCPECGYQAETTPAAPLEHVPGKLVELTPAAQREAWYAQQIERVSRNFQKLGRARVAFHEKYGAWPRFYDLEKKLYRCPGHVEEITDRGKRCRNCYQQVESERRTLPREGSRIRTVLDAVYYGAETAAVIVEVTKGIPPLVALDLKTLTAEGFIIEGDEGYRVAPAWEQALDNADATRERYAPSPEAHA